MKHRRMFDFVSTAFARLGDVGSGTAKVVDCGTDSSTIHFSHFKVVPSSPSMGAWLNMSAVAVTKTAVTSSDQYSLSASYEGMNVFNYQGPLCGNSTVPLPEGAGNAYVTGFDCPVSGGDSAQFAFALDIPSYAPAGTYNITVDAVDSSSKNFGCLEVDVNLSY